MPLKQAELMKAAVQMAHALRRHMPAMDALERANNIAMCLAFGGVDPMDAAYDCLTNELCPRIRNLKVALVDVCVAWERALIMAQRSVQNDN